MEAVCLFGHLREFLVLVRMRDLLLRDDVLLRLAPRCLFEEYSVAGRPLCLANHE